MALKNVFKSGKMNDTKLEGLHADNVSFNLTESMVSLIETTGSREGLLRNFLSLLTTSSRDPELINCYNYFSISMVTRILSDSHLGARIFLPF